MQAWRVNYPAEVPKNGAFLIYHFELDITDLSDLGVYII